MAFKALCIRCGNCGRACPTGIIKRDTGGQATSFLTPVIRFPTELYTDRYCLETCQECTQSCPTGSIERLTPERKNLRPIGLAVIDRPNCLVWQGENCGLCMEYCPQYAIDPVFCQATFENWVEIDSDKCNGCGSCLRICPVRVITVERA